jgi:hypothetical protein
MPRQHDKPQKLHKDEHVIHDTDTGPSATLQGTDASDIFVFDASVNAPINETDYIYGFDPLHDQIAIVNFDTGGQLFIENVFSGGDGTLDGLVWFQSAGTQHRIYTIDTNGIFNVQIHAYSYDPYSSLA